MNTAFNEIYSELYDTLYSDKPYEKEANFYKQLVADAGVSLEKKKVLSLGCGTLNHELFLVRNNCEIHGVDISQHMVEKAQLKIKNLNLEEKLSIERASMLDFASTMKFDVVLSMFNVMGFCKNHEEVEVLFSKMYSLLNSGGVFVFDFWNKEAVVCDPPQNRWKRIVKDATEILRLTDPIRDTTADSIKLVFDLIVFKDSKFACRGSEVQDVSYWDVGSLIKILTKVGFVVDRQCQFFKPETLPDKTMWSAVIVAKKS